MPYGKRKKGRKTQVVNTKTGRVLGTHSSEAKANRQLRAIHANKKKK